MPPKKSAAAAGGDEEDHSCDNFYKFYRKNCQVLEIPIAPILKQMYEEYVEEGKFITKVSYNINIPQGLNDWIFCFKIHLWDELGW